MKSGPLQTDELDYELPSGLIATRPVERRDRARLLVVRRAAGTTEHHHVSDLPGLLSRGDAVVVNDTAVLPARLIGRRSGTGGRVEGLFVELDEDGRWRVLLKSNGRLNPGDSIDLVDDSGNVAAHLSLVSRDGPGWLAQCDAGDAAVLDRLGRTPLPPYILRARGDESFDDALDRSWYQTVFADPDRRHSVAAPTAGLHMTPELLQQLDDAGCARHTVTLHVGPGTFRPIEVRTVADHPMHVERFEVPPRTLAMLRRRQAAGGRVIAVGTTSARTLESIPDPIPDGDEPLRGATDLLIAPPYTMRHLDGLLTNFHLPRSTLLALVAALLGLDRTLAVYREAVERRYRFYSYGDAMLILP